MRYNAKTERTMKMSGVDWEKYIPLMQERREWLMEQPHEDVWITSHDGLKLHGTYFKGSEGSRAVICFHGYTSKGLNDYGSLSYYYLKHGFRMLLIDERAHGERGHLYRFRYNGSARRNEMDPMDDGQGRQRRTDPASRKFHGRRYGLYDGRT